MFAPSPRSTRDFVIDLKRVVPVQAQRRQIQVHHRFPGRVRVEIDHHDDGVLVEIGVARGLAEHQYVIVVTVVNGDVA